MKVARTRFNVSEVLLHPIKSGTLPVPAFSALALAASVQVG